MESGLDVLRKIASGELPPAPIQTTLGFSLDVAADGKLLAHASKTCIVLPPPG